MICIVKYKHKFCVYLVVSWCKIHNYKLESGEYPFGLWSYLFWVWYLERNWIQLLQFSIFGILGIQMMESKSVGWFLRNSASSWVANFFYFYWKFQDSEFQVWETLRLWNALRDFSVHRHVCPLAPCFYSLE